MIVFLYGLQSPINTGMILRSAEAFGHQVAIYDAHGLFNVPSKVEVISDFACGALQRTAPTIYRSAGDIPVKIAGRDIATSIASDARQAQNFIWKNDDVLWFGNEYDGLPTAVEAAADARVKISMPNLFLPKPASTHPIDPNRQRGVSNDGTPNLNVAVAASILCYLNYVQSVENAAP